MYMKLVEEPETSLNEPTAVHTTNNKMVNMNGNHIIEPSDGCSSVRSAIEFINAQQAVGPSPVTSTMSSLSSSILSSGVLPTSTSQSNPPVNGYSSQAPSSTYNNNNSNIINNQNYHHQHNSNNNSSSTAVQTSSTMALIYYRDATISGQAKTRQVQELPVGTIVIDKAVCQQMTARQLREKIQKDIPHEHFNDFNTNYVFLTRYGSPLEYKKEESVSAWSVVNIKRQQIRFRLESNIFHVMICNDIEKSRFMLLFTITCSFDKSLKDVRELIRTRMLQIVPEKPFTATTDFYFLCDRRVTVSRNNESNMMLVDILSGSSSIKLLSETDCFKTNKFVSSDNLQSALSCSTNHINQAERQSEIYRKISLRKKPSKSSSFLRGLTRTRTAKSTQVMLSYARSDMSAYVKPLKEELTKLGLSVYLDVDEIKSGQDWQDSLNDAVLNVDYFVPLISQNYGRTKWTNKEVKLADLRHKVIIPINFLEAFPPECLAIQFCTTQYIPWQGVVAHESTNEKFESWSSENIKLVAKCVHERIQELKVANSIPNRISVIDRPPETMTNPSETILETESAIVPRTASKLQSATQGQRKKILISAHPDQTDAAQRIKALLLDEYDVWVSSENTADEHQQRQALNASNKSLDRIPEEDTFVTSDIRDYARKLGETHKSRTNTKTQIDPENRTNINVRQLLSHTARYTSSLSPHKKEELVKFQSVVAECDLVLIIESQCYYNSRTSEKQVFYLGNRKKIIRITTDDSMPPVWYSKINPQITTTLDYKCSTFEKDLKCNIINVIENKVKIIGEQDGGQVSSLRKAIQDYVPDLEKLVYICGSTNYVKNARNEALCCEISAALRETPKLCPVTNGCYGITQRVAEMYEDQRSQRTGQNGNRSNESNDSADSQIIHLLPVRDPKDCTTKAAQKQDSTFDILPHGRTFFYGNSMEERDVDVARIIDVCIFLGNNKDENVREFEEFRWNDHYVIPIPFSEDDDGVHGEPLPSKIYECPKGVTPENWSKLMDINTPPSEVAKTLIVVICEIKRHICEHRNGNHNHNHNLSLLHRKKRMAKRQTMLTRVTPNSSTYWTNASDDSPCPNHNAATADDDDELRKNNGFKMFKIPLFSKKS